MPPEFQPGDSQAALIRKNWMTVIALSGSEHRSWLQSMVTNDVKKLQAGEGCYAGHLTAQGKLVAQMIVLAENDRLLLLVETAAAVTLASTFDRLIVMEDVQVANWSATHEVISIFGSGSAQILQSWAGQPLTLPHLYSNASIRDCTLVRNELGFDILAPQADADRIFSELLAAGAAESNRQAWEITRVEAGMPIYGIDLDETTVLPELGGVGISYDKGCYIGQEVVARIKYLGHVNRKFVGFVCEGDELPAAHAVVRREGKDVGYVTSSVFSPRLGKVIALGFVNRFTAEPDTPVQWISTDGPHDARVTRLPFA